MRLQAVLDAPCDPDTLYPWVADLARYPSWLDLIREVTPLEPQAATAPGGPATAAAHDLGAAPHEPARPAPADPSAPHEPARPSPADPAARSAPADPGTRAAVGDSWSVVLSARIGPLRRSKRLRMVCTIAEPPTRARFERAEADGREHASWVLEARVEGSGGASQLRMDLSYDGRLWGPLVERVLQDQIEAARPRLVALVTP
jgi:hypothetical protein